MVVMGRPLIGLAAGIGMLAGCGASPAPIAEPDRAPIARVATAEDAPLVRPPAGSDTSSVKGEVVMRFKEGAYEDGKAPAVTGAEPLRPIEGIPGAWVYRITGGTYTTADADHFRNDPRLAYAEPNYRYHIVASGADGATSQVETDFAPPGEDLQTLWGIRKIQAPAAWDKARGKSSVLVAVIDTGVDYNHPDLQGIVVKGPDVSNGDGDPMDDHGHGTHVAGTIAARSNGEGVVGVAFGVKVLAIKALDEDGSGPEDGIARAVDAAVRNGAKVINMSLGGPDDAWALRDAVARATRAGVLCVVAAGNDGDTRPDYPAANPEALAVGATDTSDKRAYFSNYGDYVQIAAPGVGVYSTMRRGRYDMLSGTSMAAPHVAGAAGLLLSANAGLSVSKLKKLLVENGDSAAGFPYTPSVKRLNLSRSLQAAGENGSEPTPPPGGEDDPDAATGISGVTIVKRATDGATIRWKTDVPTRGFLEYGPSKDYAATTHYEEGYSTDHEFTFSGLKRLKWYHFRVHGQTQDGRKFVSSDHKFLTKLWWLFSLDESDPSEKKR
jgi:thermitase